MTTHQIIDPTRSEQAYRRIVETISTLPQVDALLLGGSRASGVADATSDYDIYLYTTGPIPVEVRKALLDEHCSYMEYDNRFWETEDDGVLVGGVEIELIYRSMDWLDGELQAVIGGYRASGGYTTCLWSNLLDSKILFDRHGTAGALQTRWSVPYPEQLRTNIIARNLPILTEVMPAFRNQVAKAIDRRDIVSILHRTTEFFASYFDIIFGMNRVPHPGEKRLIELVKRTCAVIPEGFEQDAAAAIRCVGTADPGLVGLLEQMTERLKTAIPLSDTI